MRALEEPEVAGKVLGAGRLVDPPESMGTQPGRVGIVPSSAWSGRVLE